MHVPIASVVLRNPRPMVTFSFDDVPHNAATVGADMVEAAGGRATFYVSGGLLGGRDTFWDNASGDDIVALASRGHELACHTYSHRRIYDLDPAALGADLARNRSCLESIAPLATISNFAFPYGIGSLQSKRLLRHRFKSCRSIVPGINSGRTDLSFLKSVPLIDSAIDSAKVDALMDATAARNGWLIFYGHDVAAVPSAFGCSTQLLAHALGAANKRGIVVKSVAEALRLAGQ